MRRRVIATGAAIVQLKVQLLEVEPVVWRRLQIPAAATVADLHEVLQAAMGWTNSHLHEFQTDAGRIGMPDPEWHDEDEVRDEAAVTVGEVATPGARLSYVYDFGDHWSHDLTVEQILVAEAGVRYPRCLDGAGACPPEDVGGPGGYEQFLEALRDPAHTEHETYLQWGAGFDPNFDLVTADSALARLAWKNAVPGPAAPQASRTREAPPPALRLVSDTDEPPAAITLRCTGKLLKVLRARPHDLLDAPPSPQDWYANLLWLDGRKCVLITHAGTLFSLFLPDVLAADLRPIGAVLVPALHAELAREGLPADTFGHLRADAVHLAKTADRSVLGCMNDLGARCEWTVEDAGGLAGVDLAELHHGLQRNRSGARAYSYAIDLVRRDLEATR